MFGKQLVRDMIGRSAENGTDRRRFLQSAGAVGFGVVGGTALMNSALASPGAESGVGGETLGRPPPASATGPSSTSP